MKSGRKRIAIIGNSGSGKSTLAVLLGKELQIPVYHLDKMKQEGLLEKQGSTKSSYYQIK